MKVEIMDCTLRDGANIVGNGFSSELTDKVLMTLTKCKVPYIEFGNAGGIGAYEVSNFTSALKDEEYLKISEKYLCKESKLGMFLNGSRYGEKYVDLAKNYNLDFLRVGTNADDYEQALPIIEKICNSDIEAYYSSMKAYIVSPEDIVKSAKELERAGLKIFTIMDSAGTMTPEQVEEYIYQLKENTSMKIAFHGHNNLGLSVANGLAAVDAGADIIDCGIFGMARSAGNIPTEVMIANLERRGVKQNIDFYDLLKELENIIPLLENLNFKNFIKPLDLVLGLSGAHSKNTPLFEKIAKELNVDLFKLIVKVSEINKKNPSDYLIKSVAEKIRRQND